MLFSLVSFCFHLQSIVNSNLFSVSSLTGEGIEPLRDHLKKLSQEREWRLDEMAVTTKVLFGCSHIFHSFFKVLLSLSFVSSFLSSNYS